MGMQSVRVVQPWGLPLRFWKKAWEARPVPERAAYEAVSREVEEQGRPQDTGVARNIEFKT